jgi:copper(I)-binding protein
MIKTWFNRGLLVAAMATSSMAMAEVTVKDAYARAVPPGQMNSASFMMLKNDAEKSVSLVSGSSSGAKVVELHNHINENGVMKMRQVEKIEIPANGMAHLQPGGLHVMLIGLKKDLMEGDNIDLNLEFSDGSSQELTIPVKKVMGGMKHHKHH